MLFIPIYALYFHLIFVTLAFVYSFCICFSTHLSTGFNPAFSHLLQWISMRNLQFSTMKKNVQSWQQKKVFLLCDTTVFLNLKDPIQVLGQVSTLFYFLMLPCSDLAPWCPSLQLFPFRCGSGGLVAGFWCPCKLSQQFTLLELVLSISMPFLAALLIISHEIFATFSKYNSWI